MIFALKHHTDPGLKKKETMQRITITLDDDLVAELDRFIDARGYRNRSEAIRDLARAGVQRATEDEHPDAECAAAVVYVYDHETRELPRNLTREYHHHSDLSVATFHIHLDRDSCMEVTALRGRTFEVRHFAEHVIAERGVRHGSIVLVPMPSGKRAYRGRTRNGAPALSKAHGPRSPL
jgi:CopG family nickel-responsive transcriptional regulator